MKNVFILLDEYMIFFAQRANICLNKNNLVLEVKLRLAISNRNAVRIFKMCGNHFSEKLIRVNFKVQPKDANDHGCTFPMTTIRGLRGAQGLRGEGVNNFHQNQQQTPVGRGFLSNNNTN